MVSCRFGLETVSWIFRSKAADILSGWLRESNCSTYQMGFWMLDVGCWLNPALAQWKNQHPKSQIRLLAGGQNLGQVHRADRQLGAGQCAAQLHQATGIDGDHRARARSHDGLDLGSRHATGDFVEL